MTPAPPIGSLFQRYLHRNYRVYSAAKYWFQRRVTPGFLILVTSLTLVAALGVDTNLAMAYQTFALVFALLGVAMLASRFSRSAFTAQRALPKYGAVGEPLTYQVTVRNLSRRTERDVSLLEDLADPRPSLRQFVDTPEPGESKRNWFDRTYAFYRWTWLIACNSLAVVKDQSLPTLPPQGTADIPMQLIPTRRGVLRFRGLTLACPEPFGLFRALVSIARPQTLLILPRRYALPPIALPGTMKYQQGGVALAAAVGESEEFVSLRDYRPGDPRRHIHWKSWAKTGKPIVKEFQDEFFVRHALILDTFSDVAQSERFEAAVSVAASFACTIRTQDSLLDLMFVGPEAYCFTAGRGLAQADQMLEILACVRVCLGQPFDLLTHLVTRHLGEVSGCICVLLAWDEARRSLVQRLRMLGVPTLIFVIVDAGMSGTVGTDPSAGGAPPCHVLEVGKIAEGLAML